MRPILLDITCFRGWIQRTEIQLDAAITVIVAENKRGKSSTMNALEWCLFGSDITNKGSGIDERQDWEIHPRSANDQPALVRLVFEGVGGRYELMRRRSPKATSREPDELSVTFPDGNTTSGESALQWLTDHHLPDWQTYRRAHCFHQEAARTRVLDAADRSAILAGLLGLEAEIDLRDNLEAQKPANIIKTIDQTLSDLAADVRRSLHRPLREVHEIEARLEDKGIQRIAVNDDLASEVRGRLFGRARSLAQKLKIQDEFPDETDTAAVLQWARSWPSAARLKAPALESLERKRGLRAELANGISAANARDTDWATKNNELETAVKEGGDLNAREAALSGASTKRTAAEDALRRANARMALLHDVKKVLDGGDDPQNCPVCASPVPDLVERVDAEIATLKTAEMAQLGSDADDAKRDVSEAKSALSQLQHLVEAESQSRQARDKTRAALRDLLDSPSETEVHDAVAEAKKRCERIEQELGALDNLANERDESLRQHEQDAGLLVDIERLFDARQRAASLVDFSAMDSWRDLNTAIDRAAGFACDLEALAQMARTIQEEHSAERVDQVNAALGKYYALITGETAASSIRVRTRLTARKLGYDLIDHSDNRAVPVLNQAAMNALSLSLLFAQAESRANHDGLHYIVLDDPIQSLDAEHQAGLARAIEALPSHWGVMVGVVESPLVERLREYVSVPRRIITLGQYSPETGSQVASQQAL